MGMPQQSSQPQGKSSGPTFSGQTEQPKFGQPGRYSNTVGPWDNASIVPQQSAGGKNGNVNQPATGGKGGKMQSNYQPSYPTAPVFSQTGSTGFPTAPTNFPVVQPASSIQPVTQTNPVPSEMVAQDYFDPTSSNWSGA